MPGSYSVLNSKSLIGKKKIYKYYHIKITYNYLYKISFENELEKVLIILFFHGLLNIGF